MADYLDAEDTLNYASDLGETLTEVARAVEVGDWSEAARLLGAYGDLAGDVALVVASVPHLAGLADPSARWDADPRV